MKTSKKLGFFMFFFCMAFMLLPILNAQYTDTEAVADGKLDSQLVAYYELEESSGDALNSENYNINGSYQGSLPTQVSGKIGNAQDFDGSGDYINSTSSSLQNPQFTVSGWVKMENIPNQGRMFSSGTDSNDIGGFSIFADDSSNEWNFRVRNGGGSFTSIISSTAFQTGQWVHLAGTYDGNNMTLYVNGNQEASGTESLSYNSQRTNIGKYSRNDVAGLWDGEIDEVGIWSQALNSSEIQNLYNSQAGLKYGRTPADPNNISNSYLNEQLGNYWQLENTKDSKGSLDLTNNGGTFQSAIIDDGVELDGSSDYLTTGQTVSIPSIVEEYSISGWFNADTVSTDQTIIGNNDGSSGVKLGISSSGSLFFCKDGDIGGSGSCAVDSQSLNSNQWYHFEVVRPPSSGYIFFYIDGKLSSSQALAESTSSSSENLEIGRSPDGGGEQYFDGELDELGIWTNTDLSEYTADVLYNGGSGVNYSISSGSNKIFSPNITQNISDRQIKMFDTWSPNLDLTTYFTTGGTNQYWQVTAKNPDDQYYVRNSTEPAFVASDDNNWVYDRNFTFSVGSSGIFSLVSGRLGYDNTTTTTCALTKNSTDVKSTCQSFNLTIEDINKKYSITGGNSKTIQMNDSFGLYAQQGYNYFGVDLTHKNNTAICLDVNTTSGCQNADEHPNISVDNKNNVGEVIIDVPQDVKKDEYDLSFKTIDVDASENGVSPILSQALSNLSTTSVNGGDGDSAVKETGELFTGIIGNVFPNSDNVSTTQGFMYFLVISILTIAVIMGISIKTGYQGGTVLAMTLTAFWFIFFTIIGYIPLGIMIVILLIALVLLYLLVKGR